MGIEIREKSPGRRLYETLMEESGDLSLVEKLALRSAWVNEKGWEDISSDLRARFESVAERAGAK